MEKRKASIDFDLWQYELLRECVKKNNSTNSKVISDLLKVHFGLNDTVKDSIVGLCIEKIESLSIEKEATVGYERMVIELDIQQYSSILKVLKGDSRFSDFAKGELKKIKLKEGYVKVSPYWIILDDFKKALDSKYVGVIEVKNGEKFDAPHFVFFSDVKYAEDYSDEMREEVLKQCVKKMPRFQEVIDQQVELRYDDSGRVINMEEHMSAPIIGFFSVLEKNDPLLEENYIPPFGCVIVRD